MTTQTQLFHCSYSVDERKFHGEKGFTGGSIMKGEASEAIVRGLKAAGVDFVAILPDHGFDRVQKRIAEDESFTFVPVSNEGIGAGVCAGAFFGGKSPALMIPTSASWWRAGLWLACIIYGTFRCCC